MNDKQSSYLLKKFYRNIIKWWFVTYNPSVKKIWPSKAEKEAALKEEQLKEAALAEEAYNSTTDSYSGLYGTGNIDEDTNSLTKDILRKSSSQHAIDSILINALNKPEANNVILPPEQDDIINEANAIYERMQSEAKAEAERIITETATARDATRAHEL